MSKAAHHRPTPLSHQSRSERLKAEPSLILLSSVMNTRVPLFPSNFKCFSEFRVSVRNVIHVFINPDSQEQEAVLGTPNEDTWPGVHSLPHFKPDCLSFFFFISERFTLYSSKNLRQAWNKPTCDLVTIIDISTTVTSEWGLDSEELHLKTIKQVLAFFLLLTNLFVNSTITKPK
ncbi:hypothetical protein DBR06_SOUSAS8410033 [Sousa chinensis]|nr:hypothetical protein DBR06_SOUSAS8410033 [Sousa chinensis]